MQSLGNTFFSREQKYNTINHQQMIQMKDFSSKGNQQYRYQTFNDEDHGYYAKSQNWNKNHQRLPPLPNLNYFTIESQKNHTPNFNIPESMQPNIAYHNPYYYTAPDEMTLNGKKFKIVEKPNCHQKKQTSHLKNNKVPDMPVTCKFCQTNQKVIGNATQFKCYSCSNKNKCIPMFNLIRCTNCNVNVCYKYNTSDLVKCTKCGYVNKVSKMSSNNIQLSIPKDVSEELAFSEKSIVGLIEYPDFISQEDSHRDR